MKIGDREKLYAHNGGDLFVDSPGGPRVTFVCVEIVEDTSLYENNNNYILRNRYKDIVDFEIEEVYLWILEKSSEFREYRLKKLLDK